MQKLPISGKTYYGSACFVCLRTQNVRRCSSCKTLAYCGNAHQKQDWKHHKELCTVITEANAKIPDCTNDIPFLEWRQHRLSFKIAWESSLKRSLHPCEDLMWMFPRACEVCHSKIVLEECPTCCVTAYCSIEHRKLHRSSHMRFCHALSLCLAIDRHLLEGNGFTAVCVKDIDDYHHTLPGTLEGIVRIADEIQEFSKTDEISNILKCQSVKSVGTILQALESTGLVSCRTSTKTMLTLHVVGSASAEYKQDWGNITEILLHWVTNLLQISYVFVGPEVLRCELEPQDFIEAFCDTCRQKSFKVSYHHGCYHEGLDKLEEPDLIFAFNCGFHEYQGDDAQDTWNESLPAMLARPLVMTSYTQQEMQRDLERIRGLGDFEFILENLKNPYSCPRPYRDWSTKDTPIYYNDSYVSIIKPL